MARATKEELARRKLDKQIEAEYYKHCVGTTMAMSDIPKFYNEVAQGVTAGGNITELVKLGIIKYNKP